MVRQNIASLITQMGELWSLRGKPQEPTYERRRTSGALVNSAAGGYHHLGFNARRGEGVPSRKAWLAYASQNEDRAKHAPVGQSIV